MAKLSDTELLDLINRTVCSPASKQVEKAKETQASVEMTETIGREKPVTSHQLEAPLSENDIVSTGAKEQLEVASTREKGDIITQTGTENLLERTVTVNNNQTLPTETAPENLKETAIVFENSSAGETESETFTVSDKVPMTDTPAINSMMVKLDEITNTLENNSNTIQSSVTVSADQMQPEKFDVTAVSEMSKEEILKLVQEYTTELQSTRRKLERSERQLTKANDYNGVLRNMVEQLSSELHRRKHKKFCDVHVQVDKDDFLAYTTGEFSMPNWIKENDDHGTIPMDITATDTEFENKSAQQVEGEGAQLSIADSIKQTAEAVVQQQQADMLYDQGYVYDESSGLYYHSATGYYYDPHKALFYDPSSGTYYYYDYDSGQYVFHSRVEIQQNTQADEQSSHQRKPYKKSSSQRKGKVPQKSSQDRDMFPLDVKDFKNRKERRKAQLDERYKNQSRFDRDERHSSGEHQQRRKRWHSDSDSSDTEREMSRSRSTSPVGHRPHSPRGRSKSKQSKPRRRTADSRDRQRIRGTLERTVVLTHSGESDILTNEDKKCFKRKHHRRIESSSKDDDTTWSSRSEYKADSTDVMNIFPVACDDNELKSESDLLIVEDVENESEIRDSEIESRRKRNGKEVRVIEILSEDPEMTHHTGRYEQNEISTTEESYNKNRHKSHNKHGSKKHQLSEEANSSDNLKKKKVKQNDLDVPKDNDVDQKIEDFEEISEMESGELSDSDKQDNKDWIVISETEYSSELLSSDEQEMFDVEEEEVVEADLGKRWPPCIRVMVVESECLAVGTFFIVTCTGAKIGRENCDICIPDFNVSKVHAEIHYKDTSGQYEILDLASQNGTFLNDQRLAPAKIASEAFVLNHDDTLTLGTTKLLCHIHTGSDTCDRCEPGVVIATHRAQQPQPELKVLSKEERLRQKKQELNQIKKKYGLKNSAYEDNQEVFNNPKYTNKAEERRQTVGSDVLGQKHEAPASVHRPIATSNIGHKLLQKMGWKEGESLGKTNTGLQEPISVTLRANQTAGLGSSAAGNFTADDANSVDMKKASRRIQAQQRYNKIGSDQKQAQGSVMHKPWTQGDTEFT